MEIKRDKYLNDLIDRMHNGMIKVVTGIRRCGKSYLLFNIFKRYLLEQGVPASHLIMIELDQRKNKKYRDPVGYQFEYDQAIYRAFGGRVYHKQSQSL